MKLQQNMYFKFIRKKISNYVSINNYIYLKAISNCSSGHKAYQTSLSLSLSRHKVCMPLSNSKKLEIHTHTSATYPHNHCTHSVHTLCTFPSAPSTRKVSLTLRLRKNLKLPSTTQNTTVDDV